MTDKLDLAAELFAATHTDLHSRDDAETFRANMETLLRQMSDMLMTLDELELPEVSAVFDDFGLVL